MSTLSDSIDRAIQYLGEIIEHAGAMAQMAGAATVPPPRNPEAGTVPYGGPLTGIPFAGTESIDLGDPYDPEGKGQHHVDSGKGLPNDGTAGGGRGSLPNEGLPPDYTNNGLSDDPPPGEGF